MNEVKDRKVDKYFPLALGKDRKWLMRRLFIINLRKWKVLNEIGEILHLARENSGVSISEVSKDLNIKEEILENIEDGKVGAFKDIFELKNYLAEYAKYLGLDSKKIIDEFNEYMFEYTSKIPIKEIEKTIELKLKEEDKKEEIASPYTKKAPKYHKWVYIVIYILIFVVVLSLVIWSVSQIAINNEATNVISYKE